jgi:phage terminase large subunit-like protein
MLQNRDQVSLENRDLKSDGATRSSRTRTFIIGKKETLGYVVIYCFYKNLLFLLSSPHLCLVTRENRDKGILNMPMTPEL